MCVCVNNKNIAYVKLNNNKKKITLLMKKFEKCICMNNKNIIYMQKIILNYIIIYNIQYEILQSRKHNSIFK